MTANVHLEWYTMTRWSLQVSFIYASSAQVEGKPRQHWYCDDSFLLLYDGLLNIRRTFIGGYPIGMSVAPQCQAFHVGHILASVIFIWLLYPQLCGPLSVSHWIPQGNLIGRYHRLCQPYLYVHQSILCGIIEHYICRYLSEKLCLWSLVYCLIHSYGSFNIESCIC